jgi:hypothetical protein
MSKSKPQTTAPKHHQSNIVANGENPMAAESAPQKTRFELTVELIKAVAWPLFAIFVLFTFWEPLHLAMNQLPDIVNRSNTITIAGLTIKIDQSLQLKNREPSAEVRQALSEITSDGIQTLMNLSGSARWLPQDADNGRRKNSEMVRLGLFEEIPLQELKDNFAYGVRVTQVGRDTQAYLYALISTFLEQLNQPVSTPTP